LAITVTFFSSASELSKYVEQTVADVKAALGYHLKEIEAIRQRYEKAKKRYEGFKKFTGGKADALKDTKQLEVAGFKVLVNPTAEYELTIMEEAISSLQERLDAFEKTRELIPAVSDENMKIGMVLNDGTPT
jgi:hypothetical protein